MRKGLFWLNDKQWAQIKPHLPTNQTGPARDDDRRIISGIIHMLQCGARWRDCPPDYGPYTTIYNRFNRWAKRGHWQAIFEALARCGKDGVTLSIDSTSIKAHRSASGGKGGKHEQAIGSSRGGRTTKIHALSDPDCRPCAFHLTPGQDADIAAAPALLELAPPMSALIGDKGYDGDGFRAEIVDRGAKPVIPNKSNRVILHSFNKRAYKGRNVIERCFCRLKDFRRVATRYDKLARNFLAAVHLAAIVAYWIN
ncbi:IS5 family transposase [Bradyrhizobium sp. ISRA443]|uniref:IS5 family transposase n=1 Tax=unclassified Bradyrhizobium TaxID=2631580 RepID=UPI00247A9979|nr:MULTISPECIES: IS5 family transposase [unclassified Bradyrhizobium]WGR90897.1 IS5 family transposase [Bradyrhizobium sp. ISRA435]WGR92500.1 IS5 family transposase [Bradyrhizobium sp. ISRA435]WGR96892.1 IS5 family transposase [Bradyrhizobium sp. ISRA436]WGR97687.1 IS5 family transposase [Bradyrhizobium sp. ISRA436]WGS00244.1 IS5 family transposase [Bradyrhizobium sp. ISRA436]